jgi:hypothetical protein
MLASNMIWIRLHLIVGMMMALTAHISVINFQGKRKYGNRQTGNAETKFKKEDIVK